MEIISQDEKIANLADAIVARTYEVYAYDLNIENFTQILAISQTEWPEHLLPLRTIPPQEAAAQCAPDDVALLAELQQADRVAYLIRTETLERTKSSKILEVLSAQFDALIPEADQQAIIDLAIARRNNPTPTSPA